MFEHQGEYKSQWDAMDSIADKIGCADQTLRKWVSQAERDQGLRNGLTSSDHERLKALERANRDVKRAKFCARHRLYSPKRSSIAKRSDGSEAPDVNAEAILHRFPSE